MRVEWKLDGALEELARRYEKMGNDIKDVAVECVKQGQQELYGAYYDGLARHDNTGAALDSLEIKPVKADGNEISGEVGSYMEKNAAGFFHARYQEYGARTRRGVVTFAADPWRRPADEAFKKQFRKIARDALRRGIGL